jgi:hypothetical protein
MNVETVRNPAYLTRLSCMAASLSKSPNAVELASRENFSQGTYTRDDVSGEQKEMLRDIQAAMKLSCPQRTVSPDEARAALAQYAQITGMMAAHLAMSPTSSLPYASLMAN